MHKKSSRCKIVFRTFSFVFLRFPTFSYDSLPFVHFPELSYASGQNARRCQTNPRDEKLNRLTQRKVCDEIRDIIMSDVAETTILCKGAHSEGARKSLEGAKNGLEGAQKVLEVKNRTIRTNSYEFVRIVRFFTSRTFCAPSRPFFAPSSDFRAPSECAPLHKIVVSATSDMMMSRISSHTFL